MRTTRKHPHPLPEGDLNLEMYMLSMNDLFYGASYNLTNRMHIDEAFNIKLLDATPARIMLEGEIAWMSNRIKPGSLKKHRWAGLDYNQFGKISMDSAVSFTLSNDPSKNNLQEKGLTIWAEASDNSIPAIWRFDNLSQKFLDLLGFESLPKTKFPQDKFPDGISYLNSKMLDFLSHEGKLYWRMENE